MLDELNPDKNISTIFLMLWYRYWQVLGWQYRLPLANSRGAHVSKEPIYGKDIVDYLLAGAGSIQFSVAGPGRGKLYGRQSDQQYKPYFHMERCRI